ncbi:hypothetical protein ACFWGD_01575 [Corynebacterium sp. NPDC060344]|uniref:hypothetical protein n=1 Tax=Corynebacterium sp. NPDC060344 TaxID=3347101 RepID=UPI003664FABA
MGSTDNEPLYDDHSWGTAVPASAGADPNRMSPTLRGAIIIVALLAVIAIAAAVIAVAMRGGDDEGDGGVAAPDTTSQSSPATGKSEDAEATEEAPAMDSAAMLEGAGFDVVMSGPAPEAVDAWGDYRLERSASGRVRVSEVTGPNAATLDGGQWPMSMNDCGIVTYLVVFRGVNENVMLNASLVNSVGTVVASQQGDRGWMLLTNCATPQWEFLSTTDAGNLADVVYDVHEYRQSATASASGSGAGAGGSEVNADGGETTYFYYCVEDSPGQAIMTDGSVGYEEYCLQDPQATRANLGERCCGALNGADLCGEELWFDLCRSRPPGW